LAFELYIPPTTNCKSRNIKNGQVLC